jgi:hypothetical protein
MTLSCDQPLWKVLLPLALVLVVLGLFSLSVEDINFSLYERTKTKGAKRSSVIHVPKNSTVHILCIGDSLTNGGRDDEQAVETSYPAQLQVLLEELHHRLFSKVHNSGHNGATAVYAKH